MRLLTVLLLLTLVVVASARDVTTELLRVPTAAVAAQFMKSMWLVNQTTVDAGKGLFHQPWPPNVQLPLNVSVTRYVLPVPWSLLFARAVPVNISNPTGATALYINVYVTMDTSSLISQGLMRSDCADVAATTDWGDPLPAWVENCNTQTSRVWVMIPVLPPGTWRIWLHYGCSSCTFATNPRLVFLYYEDMQTTPKGILAGSASYDATNKYVVLTTQSPSQLGYLMYKIAPMRTSALYVKFRFESDAHYTNAPAAAVWFGVWDSNYTNTQEDVVNGGYHVTFDEAQSRVCFTKSTTSNGAGISCASVSISAGAWHTGEAYIWYNGTAARATIYYDNQKLVDSADTSPQANMLSGLGVLVFGGRTDSGAYGEHFLGSFFVAHLDPRIVASVGQPVSPPPSLAPPKIGLVTYQLYIDATRALLNGSASSGVLAAPFTYTIHAPVASLSVKTNNALFYMLNASSTGVAVSGGQNLGVLLQYIGAAYYDALAWSTMFLNFTSITYRQQAVSLGFSGMWTPGDNYRGWVTVWQWGGVWLNVTLLGGHGVAAPSSKVSATSGTYAVAYDGTSKCTLYVNGTAYSSASCTTPSKTPILLTPAGSPGIRMALYMMWITPGTSPTPTESGISFDYRFVPSLSAQTPMLLTSLGVLQTQPIPAVKLGTKPSSGMTPASLTAAYATSQSAWGPFGEICTGTYGGQKYVFGVRHVWLSDDPSTCTVPLQSAPSTASPTLYFSGKLPPMVPWQHPVLINSVPRSERWVVEYNVSYVSASSVYSVVQTLGKTGYVYMFSRFGVATLDSVTYVAPISWCTFIQAKGAFIPGVTVVVNGTYYNAWVTTSPQSYIGPLSSPPSSSVSQAIAVVYVAIRGNVSVYTWVPNGSSFNYKTSAYGSGVIPLFVYTGNMITATAKVDLAVYGRYAFVVKQNDTYVYSLATELSGSKLDVPINVPYPGYYTINILYNGTKIRSGTYWLDQGSVVYLGVLGPPVSLIPIQPVQPQTATPIYNTGPLQPLNWLPSNMPLPASVSSNPIEVSAAAALAVALAAAYVTYISSKRLELGIAAAIVAFFAVVSLLLPSDYRWMINGWVIFLVTVAMLLIVYYMTR